MQKIQQTFLKNTISVSKNRCPSCSKKFLLKDDKEYCFHCAEVAAADQSISEEAASWIENRKKDEMTNAFKSHSLMNQDLENAEFSTFKPQNQSQQEALRISKEFVKSFDGKSGLFFLGEPGRGKSHLAASIAKELTEKRVSCIFISLPRLLTELKNTYNKNSEVSEKDILRAMQNTDLLILDDIGAERGGEEKGTSWARGKTFEVLDSRLGKSNVITTNYGSKELIKMYGERDFSRMVQNTTPIRIEGKNYRFQGF
ncbi:ATP-binding protein [Metabacillus indicus]|uniref:ATP-binding protein n=1 Tax=Metabacillus indicus TaxID=246786 RepID=UPI002A04D7D4|nr:ATP-binding protein [Metabacillus indicus]MDX8288859.1 ATP-binding protein [Metabacillus indicus]